MENSTPKEQQVLAEEEESILAKAQRNKKLIVGSLVLVLLIAVAVIVVILVRHSGSRDADEAIARADIEQNDSIALELYKQAALKGYKSGNRAKVEVAMRLYQNGKYEDALSYLKDASVDSEIIEAGILCLEGDCYVNLKKYDEAVNCFNQALSSADGNPQIVPFILVKEANIYRAQGKFDKEYEAYKTIIDEYPSYGRNPQNPMMSTDIVKYYERAKAAAGK